MDVLDGVRVVELAEHGFVPSCGAILGDWGAEVIKVERPTGDPLRGIMAAGFAVDTGDVNFLWELYNRNKRGVAVDLRVAEGRAVFDRLLLDADVLLTSFLPSARRKLHVEPEDCWAVNDRLVYARGHGQGQRGPDGGPRRVRRRLVLGAGRDRPCAHAAHRAAREPPWRVRGRAERGHARRRRRRRAVQA